MINFIFSFGYFEKLPVGVTAADNSFHRDNYTHTGMDAHKD
jgi:hypothetical protein